MDEDLSLGVSVDGVDASVAGLGAVAEAEKKLADATVRAANAMTKENLVAFQKAQTEYTSLKTAADRLTQSQTQVAGAAGGLQGKMGQLGSSVSMAAGTIGQFNAGLGRTIGVGAQALGSMQSLATLGLGPVGIALGAVSVAATAGKAAWDLYTQSNREAEEAAKALHETLAQNASDLGKYIGEIEREDAERRLRNHMLSEQASQTELEAEMRRLNAALEAMRGTALEGSASMTEILRQRLDLMARMTEEATQARADTEARIELKAAMQVRDAWIAVAVAQLQAKREGTGAYAPRRGGGGGGAAARAEAEREAQMREDDSGREADAQARLDRLIEDMDAEAEVRRAMRDLEIDEQNSAKDRSIAIEQARVAGIKAALDREVAARAKAAKTSEEVQKAVGDAHSLVSSIIQASAGSSERAQKKALQAEAAASAINSGIQAAVEVARAAASYPDVAGIVAHGTAAAAYVVAAAKAAIVAGGGGGAAGSGVPSAAAQAGGGGGGSSRPNSFDSPQPANDNARGEASRVIVQVGMPMGQPADIGRAARYALLASDRRSASRI